MFNLDTNICVFIIRKKSQIALNRLRRQSWGDVGVSSVTVAELRYGADKSADPGKNPSTLDVFLATLEIVDFDAKVAEEYGKTRAELESGGTPIGPLDTMIAAHSLSLGVVLVTNNTK